MNEQNVESKNEVLDNTKAKTREKFVSIGTAPDLTEKIEILAYSKGEDSLKVALEIIKLGDTKELKKGFKDLLRRYKYAGGVTGESQVEEEMTQFFLNQLALTYTHSFKNGLMYERISNNFYMSELLAMKQLQDESKQTSDPIENSQPPIPDK